MLERLRHHFAEDLWTHDLRALSGWRRPYTAGMRVAVHAWRGYIDKHGPLRAAGLSMLMLMALVPILALVSSLAGGFGMQEHLQTLAMEQVAEFSASFDEGLETELTRIVNEVFSFLERTNFQTLGWIGLLVLMYAALGLLSRIEDALNAIWQVQRGRDLLRRYADYLAMLIVVPLLLVGATSLNAVRNLGGVLDSAPDWMVWIYDSGLGMLPLLLTWVGFAALYKVMPNTRVQWAAAAWGGLVAAALLLLAQWVYLTFQVGVARANAIYGSFAAVPLLLVYIHLSFSILIIGAEVSHAVQNVNAFRFGRASPMRSVGLRRRIGLIVVHAVCGRFRRGDPAWTPLAGSKDDDIPREWLAEVAEDLSKSGVLVRDADGADDAGYVPARAPDLITARQVFEALFHDNSWHRGKELLPTSLRQQLDAIDEKTDALLDGIRFGAE